MNKKTDYSQESVLKENFSKIESLIHILTSLLSGGEKVRITNADFVKCYDFAFNASSYDDKLSEKLFNFYIEKCESYALEIDAQLSKINDNNEQLLYEFNKAWENKKIFLRWMIKIFTNLDRFYLNHLEKTLCSSGFRTFIDNCFSKHAERVSALLIRLINKERDGEFVQSDQIKRGIAALYEFGCGKDIKIEMRADKLVGRYVYDSKINPKYFNEYFQKPLIEETEKTYYARSQEWLRLSVPEYVEEALKKLQEEEAMAEKYYPASQKVVITAIENTIIVKPHVALAANENTGVTAMFNKGRRDQLGRIFTLFMRAASETLKEILTRFGSYVEQEGNALFSDPNVCKDPILFTTKVMNLKERIDDSVAQEFNAHILFQRKRDALFSQILNKFEKSPQFIAIYTDYEFKKGLKGLSEEEVEKKLNSVMGLIACLGSRDAFLKHYARYLSSRLLNGTSINNEAEKQMLEKLRMEWGHVAVTKIKSMLQDIDTSKETNQLFQNYLQTTKTSFGVEVSVQVLTQGCWPENEVSKVRIPNEMVPVKDIFEKFYKSKYAGKVLSWLMTLGDAEITANYNKKKYTLIATNYQYAILDCFNRRRSYTLDELKTQLEMNEGDLIGSLLPMLIKFPLFSKENSQEKDTIKNNEVISINDAFESQTRRLAVKPQKLQGPKKPEEDEGLQKDIIREREFQIDACIIRIMKSRRILDLNSIQAETKKLITLFNPDPVMIKRRIESLMERDYLKRDETDKQKYVYLP